MAVNIYFPNMSNHRIKVRVDVDATHDPIQWAHQKTRICLNVTIPYNSVISCEATRNGNPVNPLQHRRHGDSMYAGQRHIPVLLEDEDARRNLPLDNRMLAYNAMVVRAMLQQLGSTTDRNWACAGLTRS